MYILVGVRLVHSTANLALTSCVQGLYAYFNSIFVVKSWRDLPILQKHTGLVLKTRLGSLALKKFCGRFYLVVVNRDALVAVLALAAHQVLTRVVLHQMPLLVLVLQLQHQVTCTWLVPPALNINVLIVITSFPFLRAHLNGRQTTWIFLKFVQGNNTLVIQYPIHISRNRAHFVMSVAHMTYPGISNWLLYFMIYWLQCLFYNLVS